MIKFENTMVEGFVPAIRGMRHPFKVTDKSDSKWLNAHFVIGPKDRDLCIRLNRAGSPHNKFLRQIVCWTDITCGRFWWTEFDTYRFGVEKNSESTMHSIMKLPFSQDDFTVNVWDKTIVMLNDLRDAYIATEDQIKKAEIWRTLIYNLPQSYMQKRTVMMSYQAIRSICQQRKGHKLTEWADFIAWARTLPESWLLFDEAKTQEELEREEKDDWQTKAVIDAGR